MTYVKAKSRSTDHWVWYRTIMCINPIGLGSSLLFNIICSVLDVKSFYLSHQQHLNQLEAAVEDLTYMMYLHVVSVMTLVMLTLTDYWTWFRTIMGVNLMGLGSRLLSIINYSVLDAKLFYLSLQQHLNQLQTAVEDLTYMMYQYQYKFKMNYMLQTQHCY